MAPRYDEESSILELGTMGIDPSQHQATESNNPGSFTRHPEVTRLITAVRQCDRETQRITSESLLNSSDSFRPAVPGMLTMIASGDENLRQCAADLLSRRAHWIAAPDANEFLVPALVKNLPSLGGNPFGDLLVEATLSTAPELSDDRVAEIAGAADTQLRNEEGEPLTEQTAIGLLAERLPLLLSPTVGDATRMILEEFRQELFLKQGVLAESNAQSRWMHRVSMTSLFGQRVVIGGRSRDGNRLMEGRQLADECRRYMETFSQVVERVGLPDWAGAYHLFFTSALVLPGLRMSTREVLEKTKEMLESEMPKASALLSCILEGQSLAPDIERVVEEFDPSDVEQTLVFAVSLMDTILRLERGSRGLELPGARSLDAKLESAILKMTDPLLGYFAAELRRIMRKRLPDMTF